MEDEDPKKNPAVESQRERDQADGRLHEGGPGGPMPGRTDEELEADRDQEGDSDDSGDDGDDE